MSDGAKGTGTETNPVLEEGNPDSELYGNWRFQIVKKGGANHRLLSGFPLPAEKKKETPLRTASWFGFCEEVKKYQTNPKPKLLWTRLFLKKATVGSGPATQGGVLTKFSVYRGVQIIQF